MAIFGTGSWAGWVRMVNDMLTMVGNSRIIVPHGDATITTNTDGKNNNVTFDFSNAGVFSPAEFEVEFDSSVISVSDVALQFTGGSMVIVGNVVKLEEFTCADLEFSVTSGLSPGATVVASWSIAGTPTVTPSTYTQGTATYTTTATVPDGYTNSGQSITCTTSAATLFTCSDAIFSVQDGFTGDPVSASVTLGSIVSGSISPADYVDGTNTYSASITIPSGFSNFGGTPITCSDTAFAEFET